MSQTTFHVDPDIEGEVMQTLEDAGFDITVGSSLMVDFTIESDD